MDTEEHTPAPRAAAAAPPRREPPPPPRDPERAPATGRGRSRGGGLKALAALAGVLLVAILAFVLLDPGGDDGRRASNEPSSSQNSDKTPTPTPTATDEPEATATPEQTATAEPSEPESTPAAGKEPPGSNPTQLQLQAFRLNNAGKPEEALPYAQKAVKLGCKDGAPVSPCGYALFELAKAQRQTGDPAAAVKTLEDRQRRYPDDQKAAVDAEMAKAKADAGG
jgi:hypothetical protein